MLNNINFGSFYRNIGQGPGPITLTLDGQTPFEFEPVELKLPKPDDVTEKDIQATEVQREFQPVTLHLDGEAPFEFQPIELKLPKPDDAVVEDVLSSEKELQPQQQPVTMTMGGQAPFEFQPVELKIPKPDDVEEEEITPTQVQREFQPITLTLDNQAQPIEITLPKPKDAPKAKLESSEKHIKTEPGPVTLTLDGKAPFEFQPVELTIPKQDNHVKPKFVETLSDVQISQGNTVILECRVTGNPRPEVTWYKDGERIFEDAKHRIEIRPGDLCVLTIRGVDYENQGTYTCTASNQAGEDSTTAAFQLSNSPPEFTKALEDTRVKPGSDIIITVNYLGKPEPSVKWYVDNDELSKDDGITIETEPGHSMLFLDGFTKDDSGTYKCVIANKMGQATTSANITLVGEKILPKTIKAEPPKFLKKLDKKNVVEGDAVQLEVVVTGTPKPSVKWTLDKEPVEETKRVHILVQGNRHILHIEKTELDDEAEYKCVAENNSGRVECTCELLVDEKSSQPEFLTELKDVQVVEGEDVKFVVELSGSPEPEVSWFKNNVLIERDDKHETGNDNNLFFLTIYNCDLKDISEIRCKAKNKSGEVSSIANLIVDMESKPVREEVTFTVAPKDEQPVEMTFALPKDERVGPKFIQRFEDKEVLEGTRVDLEVEVIGSPKPVVSWLKDGQPVKSTHNVRIDSDKQVHILTIVKATVDDEAEYTCIAKNSEGEVSCTSEVLVEEEMTPPQFVKRPKNVQITEGDTARFESVVSGLPSPDIEWLKDGKTIKESHHFKLDFEENRSILTILDVKLTDESEYTCVISNKAGQDSCRVELLVEESVVPPEFVRKMSSIELTEGDLAQFNVRVSGTPVPDVQWFKDDVPLDDTDRAEIRSDDDQRSLVIKECTPKDAGRYRCTAVNEAGQTSCDGQLIVLQKAVEPYFIDEGPAMSPDFEIGGDITLEVRVAGYPTPSVHWEKDNIPLNESDYCQAVGIGERYTLTITGVSPMDSGTYTCIAENDAGIAKRSFTIDIQGMLMSCFILQSMHARSINKRACLLIGDDIFIV